MDELEELRERTSHADTALEDAMQRRTEEDDALGESSSPRRQDGDIDELEELRERTAKAESELERAIHRRQEENAALGKLLLDLEARSARNDEEVARLRSALAHVDETKNELLDLVRGLLSSFEASVDQICDDDIPQMLSIAQNILDEDFSDFESGWADTEPRVEKDVAGPNALQGAQQIA